MRCFVAVDPSEAVRAATAEAQEALRRAAPRADVRWTPAASMHLTLAFLGEVDPARVDAVGDAVAGVGACHRRATVTLRGLGAFPSPRRPRVLWAGIDDGAGALGALAADVRTALAPLGFEPDPRPFTAHLTIGRVRSPRGAAGLEAGLASMADVPLGRWTVDAVVLYRSRLHPQGARYEPLRRVALPF